MLGLSPSGLVRRSGLCCSDVDQLVTAASEAVVHHAVPASSALQLYRDMQTCPNYGVYIVTTKVVELLP